MPKKLNFLGGQQNYDADTGKYEPALVGANGEVPSSFKKFKKEPSEFEKNNEKRMGKKKKAEKKNYTEYNESEISEALGDAEWTVTDKTTVEDYVNTVAKQLNADPDKVLAAIKKDAPNATLDMKMADVIDAFNNEEQEEDIDASVSKYQADLEKQFYEKTIKANNYEVAKKQYESLLNVFGENDGSVKGIKKAMEEMEKNFDKPVYKDEKSEITKNQKGYKVKKNGAESYHETEDDAFDALNKDEDFEQPKQKIKEIDSYTDKLFKDLNVKTFTSKKYKNPDGEIVEIRRFGEGKSAIRYNETKDEVEQVWLNGERIK